MSDPSSTNLSNDSRAFAPDCPYVCVYGAASDAIDPKWFPICEDLGRKLAGLGLGLVFGGGTCGLMGAVARGFDAAGAPIVGVIPPAVDGEQVRYQHMRVLTPTSMAERKALMECLASAFVAVPGGIGTLDEIFNVASRNAVGEMAKPICLLDVDGFYDPLVAMLRSLADQGFIGTVGTKADELVKAFPTTDALVSFVSEQVGA